MRRIKMSDLTEKDSVKIAKIRKNSKIAKGAIYADGILTAGIEGALIGVGINKVVDGVVGSSAKKVAEVYGAPDMTEAEKKDKIAKIERNAKFKKIGCYVAGYAISFGRGLIKGIATAAIMEHETDHSNKQIYQIVKPKPEKGSK